MSNCVISIAPFTLPPFSYPWDVHTAVVLLEIPETLSEDVWEDEVWEHQTGAWIQGSARIEGRALAEKGCRLLADTGIPCYGRSPVYSAIINIRSPLPSLLSPLLSVILPSLSVYHYSNHYHLYYQYHLYMQRLEILELLIETLDEPWISRWSLEVTSTILRRCASTSRLWKIKFQHIKYEMACVHFVHYMYIHIC